MGQAVRAVATSRGEDTLSADQAADLYLWASANLKPRRRTAPGVATAVDPVEEFADDILNRLRSAPSVPAAEALDRTAAVTGNAWLRKAAADAWTAVREESWAPLAPGDAVDLLADPVHRVVNSEAQLAQVVLDALDAVAVDARNDTTVRRWFWHRQKGKSRLCIPNEENEFSDTLAKLLADRLEKIVIRREVQLQPGLGRQAGEFPDIEVTAVVDVGEFVCAAESKGNWHDDVETAIEDQLYDRYLKGPRTRTGIYVVGWFGGDAWDPGDSRAAKAGRHSLEGLRATLEAKAATLSTDGRVIHVRVIDLSLERRDLDDSTEADEPLIPSA